MPRPNDHREKIPKIGQIHIDERKFNSDQTATLTALTLRIKDLLNDEYRVIEIIVTGSKGLNL